MDITILTILNDEKIFKTWEKEFKKEKWTIINFNSLKEYELFIETSQITNKQFITIIQIHPQISSYEKMLIFLPEQKIPVILCSSNLNNSMIAELLIKGANDYVDINIDPLILTAKIVAHLRRTINYKRPIEFLPTTKNIFSENKEIKIYPDKMVAIINNKEEIKLTMKEISLLAILILNENKIVTRNDMLENIWKNKAENINSQILDKYIQILREKLNSVGENIKTIYGLGYMYKSKR